MKTFILDTNILIKDPTILALWNSTIKVVVPDIVLEELIGVGKKLSGVGYLPSMVKDAKERGFLELPNLSNLTFSYSDDPRFSKLSWVDQQLALFTQQYPGKRKYLVTEDRRLMDYARSLGLKVLNLAGFQAEIYGLKTVNISDLKGSDNIADYQRKQLFKGFLAATILIGLPLVVYFNFYWIISHIKIGGAVFFLLVVPFIFYWFRAHFRMSYGLAEFLFGFISTWFSCKELFPDFELSQLSQISFWVPFFGGIYVMVRGVDNLGKGVAGTSLEESWRKLFKE
jgi:hypothetical protein